MVSEKSTTVLCKITHTKVVSVLTVENGIVCFTDTILKCKDKFLIHVAWYDGVFLNWIKHNY